jgi:YVTN family beta-propeller protein
MIFALLIILSGNVFAQSESLHDQKLEEIVKQNPGLDQRGNSPIAMHVDEDENVIYVANSGSDSVSVISRENYTKIVEIPVGKRPIAMHVDEDKNRIYVANSGSDSVSAILYTPGNTSWYFFEIPVGKRPIAMHVDEDKNVIYVANSGSDSISIINTTFNAKIEEIPVGKRPIDIGTGTHYDANTSSYIYALYVANALSGSVSVISGENYTKIEPDIAVEMGPAAIYVVGTIDRVYVVNSGSDSVSVLSPPSSVNPNWRTLANIPVGDYPTDIAVDYLSSSYRTYVYVANSGSDSVSVISGDERIIDIPVGDYPTDIAVDNLSLNRTYVYVANSGSDSVSVISGENYTKSGENYTKIEEIPIGDYPTDIAVDNELSDRIYVANNDSDSISVIDTVSNTAVEGVVFQVNPLDSGFIQCGELRVPSQIERDKYIYVKSRVECIAKPVKGFEFVSWMENLGGNSTQVIKASPPASLGYSIADFLGIEVVEPEAKLNPTRFGNFTANFKEVPPPLPPEFWAQTYAVIGTVVTALFIPSIVSWFKSKRDAKRLNQFHREIAALYQDGKLDENDIESLDRLRNRIGDAYSEGKINEKHYETLRGEISTLYEEIFRKKINLLINNGDNSTKEPLPEQLAQIRNEVELAFSKGKITDKHFDLLNKAITKLDSKGSSNGS